jgi:hypothetical protein
VGVEEGERKRGKGVNLIKVQNMCLEIACETLHAIGILYER